MNKKAYLQGIYEKHIRIYSLTQCQYTLSLYNRRNETNVPPAYENEKKLNSYMNVCTTNTGSEMIVATYMYVIIIFIVIIVRHVV